MSKEDNVAKLITRLIELYQKEQKELIEVIEINRRLDDLLMVGENMNRVEDLLTKRKSYLKKAEKISTKVEKYHEQLGKQIGLEINKDFISCLFDLELPYSSQLRAEIKELLNLIQKIESFDQEFVVKLEEKQSALKSDLIKIKQNSKLNNSYQIKNNYHEGKFIDQRK